LCLLLHSNGKHFPAIWKINVMEVRPDVTFIQVSFARN
jgi:hypothetical protein